MSAVFQFLARNRVLVSLALASGIAVLMLSARVLISGRLHHGYLAPNLVLAWVPLMMAELASRKNSRWRSLLIVGVLWLLFFPNAPYLVTDLVHLRPRPPVPLWFDVVLLQFFIWIGLCLAFASLQRMQAVVAQKWGYLSSCAFSVCALGLAGFGIYLGRVKRWNSWDLLINPFDLMADILGMLWSPWDHGGAILFTVVFAAFLISAYITLLAIGTTFSSSSGRDNEPA
jgi:uncharacterized membrane protein